LRINLFSDAGALRDDSSPQFRALHWLADDDPAVLDLYSTPIRILVERYVLVVLYFATLGENWVSQLNFLSVSSVCEWNNGEPQSSVRRRGVYCNEYDLVAFLYLGKSKHE
jgi:hypothetical protein